MCREPACLRPEWSLVHGEYVEGEEDARDVGERLAREHIPELIAVGMLPGDRPHRGVYRVPDGSLLVRVKGRHRECRFRVSVGGAGVFGGGDHSPPPGRESPPEE
ncbi:hypothetical protein SGLAM104S_04827 [Streptomyces glaucescens]